MPILPDVVQARKRFGIYIDRLIDLCRRHSIDGWNAVPQLFRSWQGDSEFRKEWNCILDDAFQKDGGKITLSVAGGIVALVVGGIGVAALGTAIGLPAAAILIPAGWLGGNELDAAGVPQKLKGWLRGWFGPTDHSSNTGGATTQDPPALPFEVNDATTTDLLVGMGSLDALVEDLTRKLDTLSEIRKEISDIRVVCATATEMSQCRVRLDSIQHEVDTITPAIHENADRLDGLKSANLPARLQALEDSVSVMKTELGRAKSQLGRINAILIAVAVIVLVSLYFMIRQAFH